jgi:acetolactate synthase-1/2/3 large subunit
MNKDTADNAAPRSGGVAKVTAKVETVAQAFLELLSLRGIDYFFAAAGTDFASIVDAFALRQKQGKQTPRPMTIPHEIPLMCMVHGYYLASGKPQMAMVHVGIGTANGVGALMGASRGRIPILLSAGRTPITEEGSPASRDLYIHWGQESFDQAGMIREYVKWDYELRDPLQLEVALDRALAMAMTEPRGPIYLTLPREVLASPLKEVEFHVRPRFDLPTFHPDPTRIADAADLLVKAKFPVIITAAAGRTPETVQALIDLAETGAIGVVSFNPEFMNFPTEHPCHQGFSPNQLIPQADVLLVVDCDVPWYPNVVKPAPSTVVVQAGIDPLYNRYPIRGFPSDLTIQGDSAIVLSELARILEGHPKKDEDAVMAREKQLREMHDDLVGSWQDAARRAAGEKPLSFEWLSYHVNGILDDDTIVVNEFDMSLTQLSSRHPGSYFAVPHAGYLGWGVGAALGIKLALPDSTVVAAVGDGCYLFSVPSVCHYLSAAHQLPILVIIFNNQGWGAVKRATRSMHPDGWAVKTDRFPLCGFEPTGHYEKICEAFGGYGERVERPEEVGPALKRALHVVKNEKRQAVVNMICKSI